MKSPMTTLCYIERNDSYLMMHRIKKKHDVNAGKWIGVGGHFETGESPEECLLREVKEETGLTLDVYEGGEELYRRPFYMGPGFTDEMSSAVFGTATGTPNLDSKESTEDIQVILADRGEVRRILSEEQVSLRGAYLMTHFLAEGDPLEFLRK